MRTWKQGAVGKMSLKEGRVVFVKCLKYPLAVFYRHYDEISKVFKGELFYAYLDLSLLKNIERIDEINLSLTDRKISISFSFDFETRKIRSDQGFDCNPLGDVDPTKLMRIDDIECLLAKMNE